MTSPRRWTILLKRWPAFTRFLDDGRVCLSNNAAERALRGIALGRKSWLFAGSDRGGLRAAGVSAVELAAAGQRHKPGSLTMAAIAAVFTVGHVAKMLGEDEDWLWELTGCLRRT